DGHVTGVQTCALPIYLVEVLLKNEVLMELKAVTQAIIDGKKGKEVQEHLDKIAEKIQGLEDKVDPTVAKKAKGKNIEEKNRSAQIGRASCREREKIWE